MMNTGKLGLCIFLSFCRLCSGIGQIYENDDLAFGFYLFENRKYEEVILLFEHGLQKYEPSQITKDSINYILGMTHYYRKELEQSAFYLSGVSSSSAFFDKSIFFSALNHAHLGNYDQTQAILTTTTNPLYDELKAVQLAGTALLKRNFKNFDIHAEKFKFDRYYLVNSQNELLASRMELENFRKKSTFGAVALSAVVPGLGKIYTGQLGEGFAAFMTVGALAAVTVENWKKNGIANWKTITFGSIFSIFYIGNIFGTVATVRVYTNQFNEKQNNSILLAIHLPVRALFE